MNLSNKFSKESLIFISKKFANKVGDLRPALEICKSLILDHLKELRNEGFTINLKEIIMKINKTNNSFTELLSNLTLEQKIVIASIYMILSKSKKTEFSETEVYYILRV
jgi:Cdc6-like AAA superfamily ATPase